MISLVSDATSSITNEYCGWMQRHWTCPKCKKDFLFNLQERMEHEVACEEDGDESVIICRYYKITFLFSFS